MKKFKISISIGFVALLFCMFQATAQPGDPDPPDDPVPLTGIEILLIAGGALGGYKLFGKKSSSDK